MMRRVVANGVCLLFALMGFAASAHAGMLFVCGMDEVFVIDSSVAEEGRLEKLWSWRAKDHAELPETVRSRFGTTDECKPVEGGQKVLISSSGGACALVERPSGRVLWHARVPNAHSLEMLPRGRVAVASSVSATGGNDLVITTNGHVYLFDRDKSAFRLHPDLGNEAGVKCVTGTHSVLECVRFPALWMSREAPVRDRSQT